MTTTSLLRSRLRPIHLMILGTCLLLEAFVGCGGDNPVKSGLPGSKYPPSSTPQNVLAHMAIAYSSRDSTGYDSLFDASYTGASYDPFNMNVLTFTKADEAAHIAFLARYQSITSVSLTYPSSVLREADGADPPGWATISVQNMHLEIEDTPNSIVLLPTGTWQFKFAPTTPSVGSPTDTTWHIVRWTEFQ